MRRTNFEMDEDGNLLLGFGTYGQEVDVAAISGDGRRVLTVREVGRAQVWNALTAELLAEIAPESPLAGTKDTGPMAGEFFVFIESAALNADGTHALLGLNDGTAVAHRVEDGKRLAVLHPPDEEPATRWGVIRSVEYSPDGALALVGFSGRRVGVWSADEYRLIAFLAAESGIRLIGQPFVRDTLISSVAASPEHRTVFAGAADMTAAIFDLESGTVLQEMTEHAEDVLALFDNGTGIGWATSAGSVWVSRDGGPVQKEVDAREAWSEVVFDGDRWLARSLTGTITLGTLGGERTVLFEPDEPDRGMWSDDARTLELAGDRLYYPESGQRLVVRDGPRRATLDHNDQLMAAAFSPQGHLIAIRGWADRLELWDLAGSRVRSLDCPGGVGCFSFSPDGSLVALGEIGHGGGHYLRHVYVYETKSGELRWQLKEHDWQLKSVAFSPKGDLLASLGDELVMWKLNRFGKMKKRPLLRLRLDRAERAICFVADELLVLDPGRVRVFAGAKERVRFEAPYFYGTPWAISNDQRYLLLAANHEILRFDLVTGRRHSHVEAPFDLPERIPPGQIAAELDIRGGATLWRTRHGCFLHQSDGPRGWIQPLELSAEGIVVVPAAEGAVLIRITEGETQAMGRVLFEGTLRASRIAGDEVILVNEDGRIFRDRPKSLR